MIKREATYCVAFCPTRFNGYLDRRQKIVHKIIVPGVHKMFDGAQKSRKVTPACGYSASKQT